MKVLLIVIRFVCIVAVAMASELIGTALKFLGHVILVKIPSDMSLWLNSVRITGWDHVTIHLIRYSLEDLGWALLFLAIIIVVSMLLERGIKLIGGGDRFQRVAILTAIILSGALFENVARQ